MRKALRMAAVVAVLAIIAAACSDSGTPEVSPSGAAGGGSEIQAGGTLHLAMLSDVGAAFDPQKEYYQVSFEYFKCCMLRTLLATEPLPAEDGGNVLKPDLASDLPAVSDDGLTYTFSLKAGVPTRPRSRMLRSPRKTSSARSSARPTRKPAPRATRSTTPRSRGSTPSVPVMPIRSADCRLRTTRRSS